MLTTSGAPEGGAWLDALMSTSRRSAPSVFGRVIRIVKVDRFIEREGKVRGRHAVTPTEVEQVHHPDVPSGIDLGDSGDADGVLLEIDTERTRDVGAKGADGRRTYVAHPRFVHRLG